MNAHDDQLRDKARAAGLRTWDKVPLPEPVHVEAGKTYEYGIGDDGVPYVREAVHGTGQLVCRDGTITGLLTISDGPPRGALRGGRMSAPRWRLLIAALVMSLVCGAGGCGPRRHETVVCRDGTVAGGVDAHRACDQHGGVA